MKLKYLSFALLFAISLVGCAVDNASQGNTGPSVPDTTTKSINDLIAEDTLPAFEESPDDARTVHNPDAQATCATTKEDVQEASSTTPTETTPVETVPAATSSSAIAEPIPTTPQPAPPALTYPLPTQPETTEPSTTVPPETEPTEPTPMEPAPTEPPKESVDAAAIESAAESYAQSLGFIIDGSLGKGSGGYYPPEYAPLTTTGEGKSIAKGLVNATKNQLNSRFSEEYCDVLVEGAYGLVRMNCTVVYSHTDELGEWYTIYVFYG